MAEDLAHNKGLVQHRERSDQADREVEVMVEVEDQDPMEVVRGDFRTAHLRVQPIMVLEVVQPTTF
jgi:hypothetical protein